MRDAAVAAAARACVGARFRLHGRDADRGLDCVGVAAHAFGIADPPSGYALRGGAAAAIVAAIDARLARRADARRPGTLLLLAVGPFQHHLAVTTPAGFVHADAGLRRVVEVPGRPRWPIVAAWGG